MPKGLWNRSQSPKLRKINGIRSAEYSEPQIGQSVKCLKSGSLWKMHTLLCKLDQMAVKWQLSRPMSPLFHKDFHRICGQGES